VKTDQLKSIGKQSWENLLQIALSLGKDYIQGQGQEQGLKLRP